LSLEWKKNVTIKQTPRNTLSSHAEYGGAPPPNRNPNPTVTLT